MSVSHTPNSSVKLEHLPWDGDLGHLEGDIAAVADDLCADLDQLLFEARQRPVLTWEVQVKGLRFNR